MPSGHAPPFLLVPRLPDGRGPVLIAPFAKRHGALPAAEAAAVRAAAACLPRTARGPLWVHADGRLERASIGWPQLQRRLADNASFFAARDPASQTTRGAASIGRGLALDCGKTGGDLS